MNKLKIRILGILAIFVILAGMAGIASADPCADNPETWSNHDESNLYTVVATGTNPVTYSAGGSPSIHDGLREVCIASKTNNALSGSVAFDPSNWDLGIMSSTPWGKDWAQFRGKGSSSRIPLDGTLTTVGDVTWDNPPSDAIYLVETVNLDGQGVCGGGAGQTCYWRPIGPNPPVPELPPSILTTAGLLGLVLVTRKYKNK
jgi:hypothetical protein